MHLEGEHKLPAPPERVYEYMQDPEVLKECLPGCERLERIGEDEYAATMKIGVAMIKGTYDGRVKISDKDEPNSFKMLVEGKGPQGQVSGEGLLQFSSDGEGGTVIHYAGDATVRGMLARIGSRVIQPAAKMIVGKFFEALHNTATSKQTAS
jgi:carbon monoxide dehydrogenase subunit G